MHKIGCSWVFFIAAFSFIRRNEKKVIYAIFIPDYITVISFAKNAGKLVFSPHTREQQYLEICNEVLSIKAAVYKTVNYIL